MTPGTVATDALPERELLAVRKHKEKQTVRVLTQIRLTQKTRSLRNPVLVLQCAGPAAARLAAWAMSEISLAQLMRDNEVDEKAHPLADPAI